MSSYYNFFVLYNKQEINIILNVKQPKINLLCLRLFVKNYYVIKFKVILQQDVSYLC